MILPNPLVSPVKATRLRCFHLPHLKLLDKLLLLLYFQKFQATKRRCANFLPGALKLVLLPSYFIYLLCLHC